jgi:integrase
MSTTYKKTGVSNLEKMIETGTYYARAKIDGRTVRKAVGKNKEAAIAAKDDWLKNIRGKNSRVDGSLGTLAELYMKWLREQLLLEQIGSRTNDYKVECLAYVRAAWTDFDKVPVDKLNKGSFRDCLVKVHQSYKATRTNGIVTVIREIMDLAVSHNYLERAQRDRLLEDFKYVKVKYDGKRCLGHLPCRDDLLRLRADVALRCAKRGSSGHRLLDFLLFSGCRIESAQHVHWCDIDWVKNELYFRKAKYGPYTIPLFEELRELLQKTKDELGGSPNPEDLVLKVGSIHTVLTSACIGLKLKHLSHHDMRHLFATRAIEEGRDFATVAKWLGHKDNGRTVMLMYGHLRSEHSHEMAKGFRILS